MNESENTMNVSLSRDIEFMAHRSRSGLHEAVLTVRHRHTDQCWTDLRLYRNEQDFAAVFEALRRFYTRENLT